MGGFEFAFLVVIVQYLVGIEGMSYSSHKKGAAAPQLVRMAAKARKHSVVMIDGSTLPSAGFGSLVRHNW